MTITFQRLKVPRFLKDDHAKRGGVELRRYRADVQDGVLRAMVAREPAGKNGTLIWHISLTVAANGDIGPPPLRPPTAGELHAASGLLPGVEFEQYSGNPLARHLWEKEAN